MLFFSTLKILHYIIITTASGVIFHVTNERLNKNLKFMHTDKHRVAGVNSSTITIFNDTLNVEKWQ